MVPYTDKNGLKTDSTLLLTNLSKQHFVPAEFLLAVEAILVVSSTQIVSRTRTLKLIPLALLAAEQHFTARTVA